MNYHKFKPCESLQQFVECYFVWESGEPVRDFIVESPPNGFCSIVFNCGDDYFLQNRKYEKLIVPRQFVAGQSIYSYNLFFNGNISITGIVFKPAALATLYGLPTYQYTEERVPLSDIFKSSFINSSIEKLQSARSPNQKARLLEEFVLKQYNGNKPEPDYIDFAANHIVENNGMVHVAELMEKIFMSRRNFERKFFKKVGLSPKYYARIRRIGYVANLIAGRKKADWVNLFTQCEFYDQSHFIKDFLEFTGRTPQQYLEANTELANLIEKPRTQNIQ